MIILVNTLISPWNFTFGSSSSYSDDLEEDFLTEEDLNGNYTSGDLKKLLLTDADNVSDILTKELQTSITSNSSGILSKVLQNSTRNSSGILNGVIQSNTYDIMSIAPAFMNDSTTSKSNGLEGSTSKAPELEGSTAKAPELEGLTAKAPELPNTTEIKDSQDFQVEIKGSDDEPDMQDVQIYPEDVNEISDNVNVEINDYEKDDTGEKFIQGKFEINKIEELNLTTINKAMEELFDESNFTNLGIFFIISHNLNQLKLIKLF